MNKNKAVLTIIIFAILVILGLVIFYFLSVRVGEPLPPDTSDDILFPIGPDTTTDGEGTETQTQPSYEYYNKPQTFKAERKRLRLISSLPVSGATLFEKNTQTLIHYVERANGHIYEASASEDKPPYRISKTTIPKIYEAYWVNEGQGVIVRYIKDDVVQTYYARIRTSAATSTEQDLVDGTFLPSNISMLAVSPTGDRIFYLVKNGSETAGVRSNPNGSSKAQIFSSPISEWLPLWESSNTLTLITKPSSEALGYAYAVSSGNGAIKKVLGNIKGLTVLPSLDPNIMLYSESRSSSGLSLKFLNVSTGGVNEVGVNTLPEKCVWSKLDSAFVFCAVPDHIASSKYPDTWYQGKVSFTDNIWKINLKTGETTIILAPQTVAKKTMDITNMTLSKSEDYLLFTNKKDLSLWLLDLSEDE